MGLVEALRQAGSGGATVRELAERTGLPRTTVGVRLLELEAQGHAQYVRYSRFQITGRWVAI